MPLAFIPTRRGPASPQGLPTVMGINKHGASVGTHTVHARQYKKENNKKEINNNKHTQPNKKPDSLSRSLTLPVGLINGLSGKAKCRFSSLTVNSKSENTKTICYTVINSVDHITSRGICCLLRGKNARIFESPRPVQD